MKSRSFSLPWLDASKLTERTTHLPPDWERNEEIRRSRMRTYLTLVNITPLTPLDFKHANQKSWTYPALIMGSLLLLLGLGFFIILFLLPRVFYAKI